MEREFMKELKAWKENAFRKPLVLQGARQVGKSWLLKEFGKTCFSNYVYVNFDTLPELKTDFARTKSPQRLIKVLEQTFGQQITAGETLIIFDEIQECNDALNSLKYFQEEAPEYAIVAAGSLLGVALNRSGASFPVGKVMLRHLYPMSFAEYLLAADARLYHVWQELSLTETVPEVVHSQLLDEYRQYTALGGMPEAVAHYLATRDWDNTELVLKGILDSYSLDFSKHINNKDIPRVFAVWNNMQDQLARENRKFRYGDIQAGARAREYEAAIEWLCLAGIVHRVNAVETVRMPLSAYKKSGFFKLYMSDTGLLRNKFHLDPLKAQQKDTLLTEFKGALAENYVLQSLVRQYGAEIYYWISGNSAEVEFLLDHKGHFVPIEVKADINVKAKSLSEFRRRYEPDLAVRLSARNLRLDDGLLNLPLYLVDRLKEAFLRL